MDELRKVTTKPFETLMVGFAILGSAPIIVLIVRAILER